MIHNSLRSPIAKLRDIATIIAGQSPPGDTYRIQPEGLPFFQGKSDFGRIHPVPRMWCVAPVKRAMTGDILISVRAPVGPTNIADVESCIGRGLAAIRPNHNVDRNYLLHALKFSEPELIRQSNGSTFAAITVGSLGDLSVPLPPLDEQQRIAAILDKAEALREKCQKTIERLDLLISAEFHGQFENSGNSLLVNRLDDLADIVSGVTKGRNFNGTQTNMLPYLRVANVQAGYLDLSEIKYIEALPADLEKYRLYSGDVLMTEGGDHDKLGRGAIWNGEIKDCIHQNHIFRVRVDRLKLLPTYFAWFLRTEQAKKYFLSCAKKTTNLASINMQQLRALPVPVPSLEAQQHFQALCERHGTLKEFTKKRLQMVDNLVSSLRHSLFTGELLLDLELTVDLDLPRVSNLTQTFGGDL